MNSGLLPPCCMRSFVVNAVFMMSVLVTWMNGASTIQILNGQMSSVIVDDVMLTPEQAAAMLDATDQAGNETGSDVFRRRRKRNIVTKTSQLWELPIFYKLDLSYYPEDRQKIRAALEHIMDQTCIRFFEVNARAHLPVPHLMFLQFNYGCLSYIGRLSLDVGQAQPIALPYYCLELGTAVHEVMHTLGVWHQHQRPDRDRYIRVHDDVISARYAPNYRKHPADGVTSLGLPYDYSSVMHYGSKHGSINGSATITTIDRYYDGNLGQRLGLSFLDAKLLNGVYCKDKCKAALPCQNGGYPDPNDCSTCRCPSGLAGVLCTAVAPSVAAKCGGQFDIGIGDTLTVTSPSHTDGDPSTLQCNWLFQSNAIALFSIRFSAVSKQREQTSCPSWVEVTASDNLGTPGYRFCTTSLPSDEIVLRSRSVLFVLRANSSDAEEYRSFAQSFVIDITAIDEYRNDAALVDQSTRRVTRKYRTTSSPAKGSFWGTTISGNYLRTSSSPFDVTGRRETGATGSASRTGATGVSTPAYSAVTWSSWSSCKPTGQCSCGGCTNRTRYKLCNKTKCSDGGVTEEREPCAIPCTKYDYFYQFLGRIYKRSCPRCCRNFYFEGGVCRPRRQRK